jgi:hypothetical protein
VYDAAAVRRSSHVPLRYLSRLTQFFPLHLVTPLAIIRRSRFLRNLTFAHVYVNLSICSLTGSRVLSLSKYEPCSGGNPLRCVDFAAPQQAADYFFIAKERMMLFFTEMISVSLEKFYET